MLKDFINSIEDSELKKKVISTMQQARLDGLLSYDGNAFAITGKGKEYIYRTDFVSHRLEAEQNFLRMAKEALKIDGLDSTYQGEKFFIFNRDGKATETTIMSSLKDSNGEIFCSFASDGGKKEIMLPKDAIDKIAFKDKEKGEQTLKELLEKKPEEMEELFKTLEKAEHKANNTPEYSFSKGVEETQDGYVISLEKDASYKYDKLHIPKENVQKLENGEIKISLDMNKEYTAAAGENSYTVNASGAEELLKKVQKASPKAKAAAKAKNSTANKAVSSAKKGAEATAKSAQTTAKSAEKVAKAAEKTVEAVKKTGEAVVKTGEAVVKTANTAVDATVNTADVALTAAPPAKAVSGTINTVYKIAQGVAKTAEIGTKATAKAVQTTIKTSLQSQKL